MFSENHRDFRYLHTSLFSIETTRLYFSAADGYKAGGFDGSENAAKINATTPADAFEFEPEEATTIELGAKIEIPEKFHADLIRVTLRKIIWI